MRRMILLVLLNSIIIASLTACYDAREIDEWAYVYSIGVDKGVSNKLRMTIQISTMKGGGGEGGQDSSGSQQKGDFSVISLDCPTFYSGVNMINASLSRKINYMHSKFFVVSEDLAKEDIGVLSNAFVRDRQIRRTMHMLFVKGKAEEFISEIDPIVGVAISKTQEGMMGMEKDTGFFDDTSFGEFIDDLKSSKHQATGCLAALNDFSHFIEDGSGKETFKSSGDYYAGELPRKEGNKTEYFGTALFNGGKMIGELNGDETRVLLMARGEFNRGSFPIQDPSNNKLIATISISPQKRPAVKVTFKEGIPYISLSVFLEGDLQALQSTVNYEKPEIKPILEKKMKEFIKNQLDKTINKCLDLKCDAFGFGDKACMQFLTIQEWEDYDWLSRFKDAKVYTKVDFTIRRTGTMLKTNPIKGAK